MKIDKFQKEREKINQTSSQKKMWNYLYDLTERSSFIKEMKEFRRRFDIPEHGIVKQIYGKSLVGNKRILSFPDISNNKNYRNELELFYEKYGIDFLWEEVFECYVFYNQFLLDTSAGSLIFTEDVFHSLNEPFQYVEEKESMEDYIKEISIDFPVAIFLNPYVSQRDVIDYIKKTFRLSIEPKLKSYRKEDIKLGKVRRKNSRVKVRNNFIFMNRNKSKQEIVNLVANEFGDILDYSFVAKIIKEETRLRK